MCHIHQSRKVNDSFNSSNCTIPASARDTKMPFRGTYVACGGRGTAWTILISPGKRTGYRHIATCTKTLWLLVLSGSLNVGFFFIKLECMHWHDKNPASPTWAWPSTTTWHCAGPRVFHRSAFATAWNEKPGSSSEGFLWWSWAWMWLCLGRPRINKSDWLHFVNDSLTSDRTG